MGVVFGLIFFVQFFELPYINILSSLFENSKSQVASIDNFPSRNSSSNPTASRNTTQFSSSNSTDLNVVNGVSSTIKASDGMDGDATNVKDDFDLENGKTLDNTLDDDIDPEDERLELEGTSNSSASLDHDGIGDDVQKRNEDKIFNLETPSVAKSPSNLQSDFLSPQNSETSSSTSIETSPPITTMGKDAENILQKNEKPVSDPSISSIPATKKGFKGQEPAVIPISEMNDMQLQSRVSYRTVVCIQMVISDILWQSGPICFAFIFFIFILFAEDAMVFNSRSRIAKHKVPN